MITLAHITRTSGRTIATALLASSLVAGAAAGNPAAAFDSFGLFSGNLNLFGGFASRTNNWNNNNWNNNNNSNNNGWNLGPALALSALALSSQNNGNNNRSSAYAQGYQAGQNSVYYANPFNLQVTGPYGPQGYAANPPRPTQPAESQVPPYPNVNLAELVELAELERLHGRDKLILLYGMYGPDEEEEDVLDRLDELYRMLDELDRVRDYGTNPPRPTQPSGVPTFQVQRPPSAGFQITQFSLPPAGLQIPTGPSAPENPSIADDIMSAAEQAGYERDRLEQLQADLMADLMAEPFASTQFLDGP